MSVYQFLALLPSILALTGFVAFLLLRGRILDDHIVKDIVAKLRNVGNLDPKAYAEMTPARLKATLDADRSLRDKVGEQDFKLLTQALRQEFLIRVIVYVVLASIFFFGLGMFVYQTTKPKKLIVSGIGLESTTPQSKGVPVDLDPLRVTWTPDGPAEELKVVLENARTNKKTESMTVSSAEGKVLFPLQSYSELLAKGRKPGASTPIKMVIQGIEDTFSSSEVEVKVGITILAVVEVDQVTVASMIDERLYQDHDFDVQILLPHSDPREPSVNLKGKVISGKHKFTTKVPNGIDWPKALGVYLGPHDPKIVRWEFIVDDALKRPSDGKR